MDEFAKEEPDIRAEAFVEAAARMGLEPIIVEKDFWVCWTLKRLFSLPASMPGLIFKGGTSLSKVYGVIERFSEDIDLSLDRKDLGFTDERDPGHEGLSSNKRQALLDQLSEVVGDFVSGDLKRQLESMFASALVDEPFRISVDIDNSQTLLFEYPPSLTVSDNAAGYIQPLVRMEFGARSDHLPAARRAVRPYVDEMISGLLEEPTFELKVLAAERTFWEKATILHGLYHKSPDKPLGDRMSRHYYDLAKLAQSDIRTAALANLALLEAVAIHKSIFFKAAWARYDTARAGSLRLVPQGDLSAALRADYVKMSEMFFEAPMPFDDILEVIGQLESEINSLAP